MRKEESQQQSPSSSSVQTPQKQKKPIIYLQSPPPFLKFSVDESVQLSGSEVENEIAEVTATVDANTSV